ncbi:MAG: hypothetical protein C3F10_15205 [Dehalococcoidia bacterium]|nr:MAG: hypothetical protein C3F10_15205 [Dehalococcoidia bacterium]
MVPATGTRGVEVAVGVAVGSGGGVPVGIGVAVGGVVGVAVGVGVRCPTITVNGASAWQEHLKSVKKTG